MTTTVETAVRIDAPPGIVWGIVTEFESYSEWNPFVTRVTGQPILGSRLRVRIEPPGGRAMAFKPRVVDVEPDRSLAWLGSLLVPGLFDGRHEFLLEPLADGGTKFVQRESFSGALVGLLLNRSKLTAGFEAMNDALKTRAEARATREAA
ncbi:SRPBCC family protein [Haloferacaceae archaeon DSL9]